MAANIFFVLVELFTGIYSDMPEHTHHFQYLFVGLEGKTALVPWMWTSVILAVGSLVLLLTPKLRENEKLLPFICGMVFLSLWIAELESPGGFDVSGDESVLEEHWAEARSKRMKGALTLFAQDATSKLILYTAADIKRDEADDQVLNFLSFWRKIHRGIKPTFVFDSKFTTYAKLAELNAQGIKFITLRRRGKNLLDNIEALTPWKRINIPHAKRKYPNPLVHESFITLRGYDGGLRQVIVRGNGHEKPAFLISNDFEVPLELFVSDYARRWRVENLISEAVKFFHLNALSSPILIKVHFDVVMTMIADTLYNMLAQKLRGFEDCDAPKIYRNFVNAKANIKVKAGKVTVTFPRKAHNPILRAVPWQRLPSSLSWLDDVNLNLKFR
jgi:hypothetical protein